MGALSWFERGGGPLAPRRNYVLEAVLEHTLRLPQENEKIKRIYSFKKEAAPHKEVGGGSKHQGSGRKDGSG